MHTILWVLEGVFEINCCIFINRGVREWKEELEWVLFLAGNLPNTRFLCNQQKVYEKVRDYALKTFEVLACEGMARVDIFLKDNEEILVNEINTIPGFTRISMYPKLWEASGVSYAELVD
jgi:D-alanine-D-alanine ligase-like ATP-grasp enzyme